MDLFTNYDYIGQAKALEVFKKLFSGCTVQYEQHYDDKSPIDIYVTATTKNGRISTYAVECKDRYFEHTSFSTPYRDTPAGWAIDVPKYNNMVKAAEKGYKPIYFNTFKDNTYVIWDVLKSEHTYGKYKAGKTTVVESEKIDKEGYFYQVKDCIFSGYTS